MSDSSFNQTIKLSSSSSVKKPRQLDSGIAHSTPKKMLDKNNGCSQDEEEEEEEEEEFIASSTDVSDAELSDFWDQVRTFFAVISIKWVEFISYDSSDRRFSE